MTAPECADCGTRDWPLTIFRRGSGQVCERCVFRFSHQSATHRALYGHRCDARCTADRVKYGLPR